MSEVPLTTAEEDALDEYERLTCVAYECLQDQFAASACGAAKANAVRLIREAERKRALAELEPVLRFVEWLDTTGEWFESNVYEGGAAPHYTMVEGYRHEQLRNAAMAAIAALRGKES